MGRRPATPADGTRTGADGLGGENDDVPAIRSAPPAPGGRGRPLHRRALHGTAHLRRADAGPAGAGRLRLA